MNSFDETFNRQIRLLHEAAKLDKDEILVARQNLGGKPPRPVAGSNGCQLCPACVEIYVTGSLLTGKHECG